MSGPGKETEKKIETAEKLRLSSYGFSILQIETHPYCNMNCRFCAYPTRKQKGNPLFGMDVLKAIDSVDPNDPGFEYVCLSHYNEPLLDKRIFQFIEYAKKKGLNVLLITNGLLFSSKEIRQKLVDAAPQKIKISLQTVSERYFRARGVEYPFEKYRENIYEFLKLALDRKCRSEITLDVACNFMIKKNKVMRSVMGIECGDPSVPDSVAEIKADVLAFLKGLHDCDKRFVFNDKVISHVLDTAAPVYLDQTGLEISKNIRLKIKPFIYGRRLNDFSPAGGGKPCGTRIIGILSDGTVVPCCLAYDGRLGMGNIKNESLRKILERNQGLLAAIKQKEGSSMPAICRICQGAPTKHGAMILNVIRLLRDRLNRRKS